MGLTKTSSLDTSNRNFINCVIDGMKAESKDLNFRIYKYENKQETTISEGKALSGTLVSVDAGGYTYEGEWKDQVYFTLEDGGEAIRLSVGINAVCRDLLLKLATLDEIGFVEFELNAYEDANGKLKKHCNVIIDGQRIKGSEEHYKKISEGYEKYKTPSGKEMIDSTKATKYIIETLVPLVDTKIGTKKGIAEVIKEKNDDDIDSILNDGELPF